MMNTLNRLKKFAEEYGELVEKYGIELLTCNYECYIALFDNQTFTWYRWPNEDDVEPRKLNVSENNEN